MQPDHGGTAPDVKDDDPGAEQQERGPRRWPRLRLWLPHLVKPLRRTVLLFVLLLIVEYLVVPELVGASKDLYLLGQVNAAWLAAGLILEGLSLFCYAVLTKVLLPPGPKPSLSVLFRIDLSAAAVAHVIPAGTLGTAALGFKLFTDEGISGNDAGVMMAAKGIGSTVVLNVLLWVSLVISIALAGFQPIYGTVAIIGTVVLLAVAALVFGVTRGAGRASRILRVVADKIPGLSGERVEHAILDAARTFATMARDKRVLSLALLWASLNWLLDAASLWAFVAAFGKFVNPIELFAVYGIANVAGALPITPGGLGVVDSITPLLLVGFGVTRSVATLGVIAWRLVNFWLPIPTGALAYLSLKVKPGRAWQRDAVRDLRHAAYRREGRRQPRPASRGRFRLAEVDERQSDVGPERLAQLRGRLPHHHFQGRPDMAFQQVPATGGAVGQAEHGVQVRLRLFRLAIAAGPDRDVPDQ